MVYPAPLLVEELLQEGHKCHHPKLLVVLTTDVTSIQLGSVQKVKSLVHVQVTATAVTENITVDHAQKGNILTTLLVSTYHTSHVR